MLKKIVTPIVMSLTVLAASAAMAQPTNPVIKNTPKVTAHVIKDLPLMPGPVITSKNVISRGIGPIAISHTIHQVVSSKKPEGSIALPVVSGTGAHWVLSSCDDNLIKMTGSRYMGPVSEIYGAPGHRIFDYKALSNELNAPRLTHLVFEEVAADGHVIRIVTVDIESSGA